MIPRPNPDFPARRRRHAAPHGCDTFIFVALEAYAVLVAAIAAVGIAVDRRRHPDLEP